MLRRDRQMRMQLHQLMDACLFALSFWIAYELRGSVSVQYHFGLAPIHSFGEFYLWLSVVLIPAAPLILEAQGFYARPLLCSRRTTLWQLFKACVITTLGLVLVLFFFKRDIARWIVIWFGGISFVLVFIKEELLRIYFKGKLALKKNRRRFLLVGASDELAGMREELQKHTQDGIEVLAEFALNETSVERLIEVLHDQSVNGVIISARHSYFEQVEAAVRACELEGVEVWLMAEFFNTQISRATFDDFYGKPVMVFRTTPESSWQGLLKQAIDLFGAFLLLLIFALPLGIVALVIRLTSAGPIFFRQQRAGLNGRPFTMYKFRTMNSDAEQRKQELAALNEMSGPVFKMTGDPRVTPFGKWLRRYSIDEFPQLLNVLIGEMSLVGPRPLPVDEVKRFDDLAHRRRLSVKPGLTCLWQISGRNNVTDFKDWVRLDLQYIDNWSIWLDLKILCRTIPVVLFGVGAK
jgi:exopolysaccharide biosynthesis polyprenyl glycosylphosphotransferase